MGEETGQFATRFSDAVTRLARLAEDRGRGEPARAEREALVADVRDALDAVQAVYETGTEAVRDWPEQRERVRAHLATMRAALDRGGVDAEVRRLAGALVGLIEKGNGRR